MIYRGKIQGIICKVLVSALLHNISASTNNNEDIMSLPGLYLK